MNKVSLFLITLLSILLLSWRAGDEAIENLFTSSQQVETFDDSELSSLGQAIINHPLTHLVKGAGVNNSQALQVDYQGYERGSQRVVVSLAIEPRIRYTLSYWVRFCKDFDFARGGKLHGLGPIKPVTGGKTITAEGWSARLMFRGDGGLQTYVYHQDMKGGYGDTKAAPDFMFEPDRYYHVAMQVILNQPAQKANGLIKVWVNNKLLIEHGHLRFRDSVSTKSEIQRFMFNTFHGGSDPSWAPRDADGGYKMDCAYFDDIELIR